MPRHFLMWPIQNKGELRGCAMESDCRYTHRVELAIASLQTISVTTRHTKFSNWSYLHRRAVEHLTKLHFYFRATYVSVLTISAFSLERCLAICHPLHLYAMAGLTRAARIVLLLWAISVACASPFALYTDISYRDYPPSK